MRVTVLAIRRPWRRSSFLTRKLATRSTLTQQLVSPLQRDLLVSLLHISLSTALPTKFSQAVQLALKDEDSFIFVKSVLTPNLHSLSQMEKRVTSMKN